MAATPPINSQHNWHHAIIEAVFVNLNAADAGNQCVFVMHHLRHHNPNVFILQVLSRLREAVCGRCSDSVH